MAKLFLLFPSALYLLAKVAGELGGANVGVMVGFYLIALLFFVFWVWMLVDCAKRNFDQKTLWIVLLLVLGWVGAIAYFFAVKRKTGKVATPQAV